MSFSTTSKFVQLSPYMVMEYMYADNPNPETYFVNTGSPAVGYDRLVNDVLLDANSQPSGAVQIFNQDQNTATTNNTRSNSVVQTTENTFITLDPNLVIPYNDFNSNLTDTANLPIVFPSNISVVYDSIRYHILAGYNLNNTDGLIMQVQYPDVDGSLVTFSQIKISSGSSQSYILNPSPVTIGSNIYDKYVEVKIPSLVDMNNQYGAATPMNKPNTLAGKTSKSGNGFLVAAPIRITARQIINTTLTNGYTTYGTQILAVLSLESTDPFQNIGAYIAPADTGDFFEYFATDNGGFPEDFILFQNSIGNSYYIQHSVEVLEQVGAALLNTSNFNTIQTTAYDVPNLFRPIVRYPQVAVSFTLRYTMTLVNSVDQSRLIRISTYTSNDVGRYGADIQPLQLSVLPQQQKIYNKVAGATNLAIGGNSNAPQQVTKYTNVFIDRTLVNTTLTNLSVNGTLIRQDNVDQASQISYGIGQAYITISPFDNYFKFTFFQKAKDGTTKNIDLTSAGTYSMVFVDNNNNKVHAPSITDNNLAKPALGEIAFKVSESIAQQVLQFTNRKFYISNSPVLEDPNTNSNQQGLSKITNAAKRLSERSVALSDSVTELKIQALKDKNISQVNASTALISKAVDSARISAKSSSVIYWGNWLKEGEIAPQVTAFSGQTFITGQGTSGQSGNDSRVGKSSWQIFGSTSGSTQANSPSPITTSTSNQVRQLLTQQQLISSISSDVQGKISIGWSTPDILSYFLDPSSTGYQLYAGITKQIFIQAVTGIFSANDLNLALAYGNTEAGITTGGAGALGGSTSGQAAGDGGSSIATPNITFSIPGISNTNTSGQASGIMSGSQGPQFTPLI
jgi:hypothetical protein